MEILENRVFVLLDGNYIYLNYNKKGEKKWEDYLVHLVLQKED